MPSPSPRPDLELFSTDELAAELCNRHDAAIVMLLRRGKKANTHEEIQNIVRGSYHTLRGMAVNFARMYVMGQCEHIELEDDDEDDLQPSG